MRVAARRSATNERSPLGATRTPIRPVRWPAIRIARTLTPSRWSCATSDRPAPSRPTAHTSCERDAEPRQPAGDVRRGAALADLDPARDVRAALDRRGRLQHDVEHEVAEHEHAGRRRTNRARGGGGRHNADGSDAGPALKVDEGVRWYDSARMAPTLDRLAIDTIRTLSMDAVQKANSGHPGAPMGAAPMAYVLWTRFLRHAPTRPDWPDRDRFVLSAGHASMLLYSLLHLTGYGLGLEELQQFRQWGSRTPGPPGARPDARRRGDDRPARPGLRERGRHGDRRAAARRTSSTGRATSIVDHWTYVIASDGDLQEGIASEAASLAGHLRLGKLVVLYDDNHIQLDGPTDMAWSEDVLEALRRPTAGTSRGSRTATTSPSIERAIAGARSNDRPSLIAVRTHIGFGSPNKQDTQKAHGSPLGEDEVRLTKEALRLGPGQALPRAGRGRARRWARRSTRARSASGRGRRGSTAYAARVPRGGTRAPAAARGRASRRRLRRAQDVRRGRGARDAAGEPGRRSRRSPGRCRSCSAAPRTCPSRTSRS